MVRNKISESEHDRLAATCGGDYGLALTRNGLTWDDVDYSSSAPQPEVVIGDQSVNVRERALNLLGALDHYELADKRRLQGSRTEADNHDEDAFVFFQKAFGAVALLGASEDNGLVERRAAYEFRKKYSGAQNHDELDRMTDTLLRFTKPK